jgi:MinD superfamily P-loop ATPase
VKEIVVLSGKGGVGKSTLTASLGTVLREGLDVVMADTDVDAPNLALLFSATLRRSQGIAASEKAFIDYARCSGCLGCVSVCKFSAMVAIEDRPVVVSLFCEGCGACAVACPEGAIEIRKVVNGKINLADDGDTVIVWGELAVGESGSGKLVDVVKRTAKEEAKRVGADAVLIDGPPGIGCPVISSLKGSDYVIAVTEPTPAALSDLKRLIEVVGHFDVPVGLVLNKADLHPKTRHAIKDFARKNSMEILSEIPNDMSVPRAMAKAMSVVRAYPDAPSSSAVRECAERVRDVIGKKRRRRKSR